MTPERVITIIRELKKQLSKQGGDSLSELNKKLEVINFKLKNLYNAIAEGIISASEPILAEQVARFKQQKEDIAGKIVRAEKSEAAMLQSIDKRQVSYFTQKMQHRLMDTSTKFPKEYLRLLVKEVVVTGSTVRVVGDSLKMAAAVKIAAEKKKLSTPEGVLRFNVDWRARSDSNARPQDS